MGQALRGEKANDAAAKKTAAKERTTQAKAIGKVGGDKTAAGRAEGTIAEPREIDLPIWNGEGDPPIEWRTVDWQRAILHLRRLTPEGATRNMTQILRAVAAASGIKEATLRRYWFGNAEARKAILDTPMVRWPQRRKDRA